MIEIKPTIYSKAKSIDIFLKKLNAAPKQLCNTPEAFAGNVMEFVTINNPRGPVGTLSEYFNVFKDSETIVYFHDGAAHVKRNDDGTFIAEKVELSEGAK